MKNRTRIAKKMALIGAGIGLALFALFGLLQGSVIGGAIGIDIVNSIYSTAQAPTLLARAIIGASMLAGVIVSGVVFVVGSSSVLAAAGYIVGYLTEPRAALENVQGSKTR
jgi:hypothetical protein